MADKNVRPPLFSWSLLLRQHHSLYLYSYSKVISLTFSFNVMAGWKTRPPLHFHLLQNIARCADRIDAHRFEKLQLASFLQVFRLADVEAKNRFAAA